MNITIIGAGFTGLTAGYRLSKAGHTVTILEQADRCGGMAIGWKELEWKWPLEASYHHLFTNDHEIIELCHELGIQSKLKKYSPRTDVYVHTAQFRLDNAVSLLQFSLIPLFDRVRTGIMIALCKLNPFWRPLEKYPAAHIFQAIGGTNGWKYIWDPLMKGKFGSSANSIAASWLWARLKKRTPSLMYPDGGFTTIVHALERAIAAHGGTIHTSTTVSSITKTSNATFSVASSGKNGKAAQSICNAVILTTPSSVASKLLPFPEDYKQKLHAPAHLSAQTMILETTEPILNQTYWLNINDRTFPFLALVSHTSMINPSYYGNRYITYLGNYLPQSHPFIKMDKKTLLERYIPYIKKIFPTFSPHMILRSHLYTMPSAQPVHTVFYSHMVAPIRSPIEGAYVANIDAIFPWDRGTNYAVELGNSVSAMLLHDMRV